MERAPFWKVAAACLMVQTGFGIYPIVVRVFSDGNDFNMVVFSFYRDLMCFPLMIGISLVVEKALVVPASWYEWKVFTLLGMTGIGAQQLCFIMGLYYTTPTVAAIWQPVIPVWALAISILYRLEPIPTPGTKIGALRLSGLVFAISGALVMNLSSPSAKAAHEERNPVVGNLFLTVNTFLTGFYLATQKCLIFSPGAVEKLVTDWRLYPMNVTTWSYLFGSLTIGLATILGSVFHLGVFQFEGATDTYKLPSSAIPPLIYALLITSAFCYGLLSFANKHAPSSVVSSFWPWQIPVSLVLSWFCGFGSVSLHQVFGGICIMLGLFCICYAEYTSRGQTQSAHTDYVVAETSEENEEEVENRDYM